MFVVTVTFVLKPDMGDMFLPLMVENARTSKDQEEGCHQFDVCRGDDENVVFLYEVYDDAQAFQTHLKSEHFLIFDAAVRDMIQTKTVYTFDRVIQ